MFGTEDFIHLSELASSQRERIAELEAWIRFVGDYTSMDELVEDAQRLLEKGSK